MPRNLEHEVQSDNETILDSTRDGVLLVGFNRPASRNALNQAMYLRVAQLLRQADADDGIRAVLLHGSEDVFTAGNDIREFAAGAPVSDGSGAERPSAQFIDAVLGLRKPLLAAVNGPAVGIGATMLLHCDLVFAGTNARIVFPFVQLGLCPEFGSSALLARIVGLRQAMQLLITGQGCSAQQALALGLVNEIADASQTLPRAVEVARQVAAQSADAVMATKRLVVSSALAGIREQIAQERAEFARLLQSPAAQSAFEGFLRKKPAAAGTTSGPRT